MGIGIPSRPHGVGMSRGSPQLLVIDEDPAIRLYLRRSFTAAGYRVTEVAHGRTALRRVVDRAPDLLILDLDLPDVDGFEVIHTLREVSPTLPIVALSVRDDEDTTIAALDGGADDFVRKPFGIRELTARVRSALRRAVRSRGQTPVFVSGDLTVDLVQRRVHVGDSGVRLSTIEYEVLRLLVEKAGKVLRHREILETVWGAARADRIQYLRVAICALRRKIEKDPAHPQYIMTESRAGYRMRPPEGGHIRKTVRRQRQSATDERRSS
ncbi:MAG TPA: response regulator [Stellaceae bacterium]